MTYEGWTSTAATIKSCTWEDPPSQAPSSLFVGHYTSTFSYAVDGNHYCGKFYSSHEWGRGAEVPILYNPQNPVENCICDEDESNFTPALAFAVELIGGLIIGAI